MVFSSILRKSASSLAPLASRLTRVNRNYHSAIFTASKTLYQTPNLGPFAPNLYFSTATETAKPRSDDSLLRIIDSEIKCAVETDDHDRVEETPGGFPFKIEDNPGLQTITLTREYEGELVKVEVQMPDLVSGEQPEAVDDDNDMETPNQSSIPLVVTVSKSSGTSLEFNCVAYPDEISIDSLAVRKTENLEDEAGYEGPDFHDLDENLKKAFHKYLEIRGIKPSTTNFLFEYMLNKDSREYLIWLKKLKDFVEA
ncbi:hypothetical protein CICLE_v10032528mg [Citrus x clementina]|uniref:Mitochondrial glycoprotein family protein n=1 Tax=Citrus clementina TaxID=85681 RepID=V4V9I3_CITCL|nr:uncharacterized protein At2g39795, mitochondrial [Citrus x clementina]ESR48849.1 hypothetical protein CICLE_v10032528mg [Citrus x clementina]